MPVQNTMVDLQNYLFEEMDRLNDEDLMADPEKAKAELHRAKAMAAVGTVMVNNTNNALKAKRIQCVYGENETHGVPMLETGDAKGLPFDPNGKEQRP